MPKTTYFLGFEEKSPEFREIWQRWKVLEKWVELAIRPNSWRDCHPDDRYLLSTADDDLPNLRKQHCLVQDFLNNHISKLSVETTQWEPDLVVCPSQIPNAGMGLYYLPSPQKHGELESCAIETITVDLNDRKILPRGSLICYYTGLVHTHSSARGLPVEDRSYLMWIRGNILVDPGPLTDSNIKARYVNDPLNDQFVNCRFATCGNLGGESNSNSDPHEDTVRTSVVTTRDIRPGEELFIQYGDAYWDRQPNPGNMLVLGGYDDGNQFKGEEETLCDDPHHKGKDKYSNDDIF